MKMIQLPKEFKMGSVNHFLQININDLENLELGNSNNVFEDHIHIMKQLYFKTFRITLDWSKIEPKRGEFSIEVIEYYRKQIELLTNNGIQPLVTLQNYVLPNWFEKLGGFLHRNAELYFKRYTKFVVMKLGDLVSDWITFNDPNLYVIESYILNKKKVFNYQYIINESKKDKYINSITAMKNIIKSHICSYKMIHRTRKDYNFSKPTLVGIAYNIKIFQPDSESVFDKYIVRLIDYLFNDLLLKAMSNGLLKFPLSFKIVKKKNINRGNFFEFIGINYYTRHIVSFDRKKIIKCIETTQNRISESGYEIYPEGINIICKKYYEHYKKPIFITENGLSDEKDRNRSHFIFNHLYNISQLIQQGIPIQRYYYFSFEDELKNFNNKNKNYGLIKIDDKTKKRYLKKSARFYGKICKNKRVSKKTLQKYIH